ncbi:biotin/lipoyl-binding carrier protein [Actinosynnema sp. CS-041913]|uniref:biotin/lipoyl-binding carrier protein n=1 Tax=Actinosynnema sp. CS-041913 TaxID=3239917 RepID=UPI003D90812C
MAEEIRAEIVANVAQIAVKEGDEVTHETTVVVLESMKMEIPVLPEGSGKISRITVREGDVVQEGDLIAVVE